MKDILKSKKQLIYIITAVVISAAIIVSVILLLPKLTTAAQTDANEQADTTVNIQQVSSDSAETITLSGSSIISSGSLVKISGGDAIITAGGTYTVTGTLDNGRIIVNAPKQTVNIVLDNANIACNDSSPILVYKSKQTIITLKSGSTNTLKDGSSYSFNDEYSSKDDAEPCSTVFSKSDLVINGSGSLNITANYKNGIQSKDLLQIESANITVNAKNDGIKGKDGITAENATLNVTSNGDAIISNDQTDKTLGNISLTDCIVTINSQNDGIQAESALTISGGKYNIKIASGSANASIKNRSGFSFNESTSSADESDVSTKAIKAGKSVTIASGNITVDSADDAIHSNGTVKISGGTLNLSAGDDGIHADTSIDITGGSINIKTSYEGIESNNITIEKATVYVKSTDDGINVSSGSETTNQGGGMDAVTAGDLTVKSGYLYVDAEGDGLDSNGSMLISGGTVIVNGPTNGGNGAIDYNGELKVTGGTLIAAGSSGMAQNVSSTSTQNTVLANFSSQSAGAALCLLDSNGNQIMTFTPTKTYSSVLISSSLLKTGTAYTLSAGGTISGENKDGLYSSGTYSGGTQVTSFTISSSITSYGASSGMGGMNGMGGMGRR